MNKTKPKHYNSKTYYIGTIAMLLALYLLPAIISPQDSVITQNGVSIVCIFIGCIIGFLTNRDLILTAMCSMGALVLYGIYTPNEVISEFMGMSIIWQVIVLCALCYVIVRDGTGETIARFLLTRKITQKAPILMLIILLAAISVASAFMGVWGALMVFLPLLEGIYDEAGVDHNSNIAKLLSLGAYIVMCTAPIATGSMQAVNLSINQYFVDAAGTNVLGLDFVITAWALLLVFCIVYPLAMQYLFKCDINIFKKIDLRDTLGNENTKLTRRQLYPLIAFLVIAVYSFTASFWPEIGILTGLKELGPVLFITLTLAILTLVRVDGEQIFEPAQAFKEGVNWPIVMAIASMACIGGQLVNDEFGVKAWLSNILGRILGNSNGFVLLVLATILTVVLTNFFSNTATGYVIAALCAAVASPIVATGFNITAVAVAVTMSSQVAFLTFASSGQAAILLNRDNMDNKFIWTKGICVLGIWIIVTVAVCSILAVI
ncbi:MAG: SLC13 family permease [Eubacteriales bacterium]|nr:SLC13 family permease [Eubacteriales bacterium]